MPDSDPFFRNSDWLWGTLFQCLKEFVAVLFQLLCYARMGNYDFFNAPLILFVTLTVFAFPFLNSNLFACLRFGPWYKYSEYNFFGALFQVGVIAAFQFAGAAAAAGAWHGIVGKWKMLERAVDNGILYNATNTHGAVYNSIDGKVDVDGASNASILFDEFAAQTVFLIGLLHIMEATIPDVLLSAAWHEPKKDPLQAINHTPIPLSFILGACLLVAGVTRAFPSAHQSPQISVYLLVSDALGTSGIDPNSCWLRFAGGVGALLFVLLYYRFVYVDRGDGAFKRVAFAPVPAYMRSELLLPGVFKP